MTELRVETVRGPLVESVHRVSAVVVDTDGRRLAWSGDSGLVTFMRSAAKPFQAIPVVEDGAADAFGFLDEELSLACASHSSEPIHLQTVDRMLERIGCQESELGCGGHPPLSEEVSRSLFCDGKQPSPRWSNCSGNHTAMLALAKHHGWPIKGYYLRGHAVQERHLVEISDWTRVPAGDIVLGVDGCNTVCFGMPLSAMALAYARLGVADSASARRVTRCMTTYPLLVGGVGRPCTDIMEAFGGGVIAKIGAEGVYGAAITADGLGVALKVEDGGMRSAPIALLAILRSMAEGGITTQPLAQWPESVARHAEVPIHNTRNQVTGMLRAAGSLHFQA